MRIWKSEVRNCMPQKLFHGVIVFSLVGINSNCVAQNKDLGEQQYVVVKDYKPVLAESFKISNAPDKDTSTSTPPSLSYPISSHAANTSLEISPLRPVKIKDEALPKLYNALAKIGLGFYGTTYGEIFVNTTRSKNSSLGFHYKHFSASPELKGVGAGGFSDNLASLYGKLFVDRNVFTADLNYNRSVVHYYGYPKDILGGIPQDSMKQRFGNFNIGVGLESNNLSSKGELDYRANLKYNTLSDLFDVTEDNFRAEGMAGKNYKGTYISVDAFYDYNQYSRSYNQYMQKGYTSSHGLFSFSPSAILINNGKLYVRVKTQLDIDDYFNSFLHFYPVLTDISYTIGGNIITFHASLDGGVKKNTLLTLMQTNPFVHTFDALFLPRYSNEEINFFGGVKGNFNNKIFFAADARFINTDNLPLCINSSRSERIPRIKIIYDDVTQAQVHAEVSYRANEKIRLSLSAMHIIYDMLHEEKPWHLPATNVSLSGSYNLADKILVNADLFFRGNTYARTEDDLTPVKLDSWVDVNLGAEYRYSKILSVFLKLNNLGFSRYYIWNEYPSERFNILAGISYAF